MKNKTLINKRINHYVDHIALGVSDIKKGIEYVENLTGVKAFIPEVQNDQWYKSGVIGLGNGCFLEIIAPNPNHKKFHPFKQILKELESPRLIFWYLGTDRFEECKKTISNIDFKIYNYIHIKKEINNQLVDYEVGIIGNKGFESESPNLIQWNKLPENIEKLDHLCNLKNLMLFSENHLKLQLLFNTLGIEMKVFKGKSKMILTIDSPKGEVMFEGGGINFPFGIRSVIKILPLYKRHLFNKNTGANKVYKQ